MRVAAPCKYIIPLDDAKCPCPGGRGAKQPASYGFGTDLNPDLDKRNKRDDEKRCALRRRVRSQ